MCVLIERALEEDHRGQKREVGISSSGGFSRGVEGWVGAGLVSRKDLPSKLLATLYAPLSEQALCGIEYPLGSLHV